MNFKKIISVCVSTAMLSSSAILPAGAEKPVDINGMKARLLCQEKDNISDYNTNDDDVVNVFDFCRAKKVILEGAEVQGTVKLKISKARVTTDKSTIVVPVRIDMESIGISSVQFSVGYDSRYFSLVDAYSAGMGGSVAFSEDEGIVQFLTGGGENISGKGELLYLEFSAADNVPHDNYEFVLSGIQASALGTDNKPRELTAEECPDKSDVYTLLYERVPVVTTVTTTTEPAVVTTEEITTIDNRYDLLSFAMDRAELSADKKRLVVPVYMNKNTIGISGVTMNIKYDSSAFSLVNVRRGDFEGYGYITGNRDMAVYMSNNIQNINTSDGLIAYLEFDVLSGISSGTYEFGLYNIKAKTTDKNWTQRELTEEECLTQSGAYMYSFDGSDVTAVTSETTIVTTTVSTEPVTTTIITTTIPEPTTVITTTTPEPVTTVTTTVTPEPTTTTVTTTTPEPTSTTTVTTTMKPVVTTTTITTVLAEIEELEIALADLVNKDREEAGLSTLVMDNNLCVAADIRAKELTELFDINRPNGGSDYDIFRETGANVSAYSYVLTAQSTSPAALMRAVRNTKFESFDNPNYNSVAIGHAYDPNTQYGHYWVVYVARIDQKK